MILKNSSIPLYKQLKNKILEEIADLESDSKIKSDREYAEEYNISRITVRKAIEELVQEKYIIRIPGKGTYVSKTYESSEFLRVTSFTVDMQKKNFEVRSKVIESKVIIPSTITAKKLKIDSEDKVFRLKRIRYANNTPMAIQESFINHNLCPNIGKYDFSQISLYKLIETEFNLKLAYASNILEARLPNNTERKIFEITDKIPIFVLDQTTFLENGRPIEFVESIFRSDKYKFFNIATGLEIKN